MNERRSRIILTVLGVALLVIIILTLVFWLPKIHLNFKWPGSVQPGYYKVVEFDDGDTITVNMAGKTETVRFIGVDTPETHDPRKAVQCFGHTAANFTKNLIGTNNVRLEADPTNTNRDRYDRLLRYVYLPDGTLVNAEIIKQGYGFAYTSFPFTKKDDFVSHQAAAQAANTGLWSQCTPVVNEYGGYTSNDAQ